MSAEESSEVVNAPSPGAQLRNARELAGVSLQSISERTLISTSRLQALELDDFSAVGGTAHITGYTKAYAKVLGLDAKALIKDVEHALMAEKTKQDAAESLASVKVRSNTLWVYPLLIAVILLLLALWAALWLMNDEGEAQSVAPVTDGQQQDALVSVAEEGERLDEPPSEVALARQHDPEPASEPDSDFIDQSRSQAADRQDPATLASDSAPELIDGATAVVMPSAPVKSPASEAEANLMEEQASLQVGETTTGDAVAELPEQPITDDEAAAVGQDQLQLVFIEDCWLEVSDATGKTIIADLAKAGQSRTLTGAAPFKVLLGDATAAALILFNEESVPFAARPGQRVLRMTIGG